MRDRIHWPSLALVVLAYLIAVWLILRMPAGPEYACVANGGEWFEDLRRCL